MSFLRCCIESKAIGNVYSSVGKAIRVLHYSRCDRMSEYAEVVYSGINSTSSAQAMARVETQTFTVAESEFLLDVLL